MKILTIFNKDEENILRSKSQKVSDKYLFSNEFKNDLNNLEIALKSDELGVAISAPQIGILKRFIIISPKLFRENIPDDLILINPKIIKHSRKKEWKEEGCLSVPDIFGDVERYLNITLEYQNIEGENKKWNANKLLSRVFQHEIDHLDGIIFTDKAKNMKKIVKE